MIRAVLSNSCQLSELVNWVYMQSTFPIRLLGGIIDYKIIDSCSPNSDLQINTGNNMVPKKHVIG